VGETSLGGRDVKRPGVGATVGLALLAVQTGLVLDCHFLSESVPHEFRRNKTLRGKPLWM
jgi:hypothetical protein